jgi:hypothetical protein
MPQPIRSVFREATAGDAARSFVSESEAVLLKQQSPDFATKSGLLKPISADQGRKL